MTAAARRVLSDCYLALEMLQAEADPDRWRVHWAGGVALLRAVGHVLLNVDHESSAAIKKAGDAAFRRWKSNDSEHAVYRDFILNERNSILKRYQSVVHPSETVDVLVRVTLRHPETGELHHVDQVMPMDENIFRPIVDGYGAGEDARDVYQEALVWWDRELAGIEAVAAGGECLR